VLEVVAVDGADEAVFGGRLCWQVSNLDSVKSVEPAYLSGLAREVVGGLESARDALLDGGVTAVVGGQDRVLEASGVLEVNVELAVLALLGDGDARAGGCDVRVEDEGDNGAVRRDLGAHGALRTSSSSIADTLDGDLQFSSQYLVRVSGGVMCD